MVRIQYHDVGARIGAHVAGKRKKCVKKVHNYTFSALFVFFSASRPSLAKGMTFFLSNTSTGDTETSNISF